MLIVDIVIVPVLLALMPPKLPKSANPANPHASNVPTVPPTARNANLICSPIEASARVLVLWAHGLQAKYVFPVSFPALDAPTNSHASNALADIFCTCANPALSIKIDARTIYIS